MNLRNPWIDPRVAQVRPEQAQGYLDRHGWKLVGPATNPHLLRYELAEDKEEAPTLFVPVRVDEGAGLQWMVELVEELALWQGRYAGDVVSDLLRPAAPDGHNGPAHAPSEQVGT
jgi:hypothetical protein